MVEITQTLIGVSLAWMDRNSTLLHNIWHHQGRIDHNFTLKYFQDIQMQNNSKTIIYDNTHVLDFKRHLLCLSSIGVFIPSHMKIMEYLMILNQILHLLPFFEVSPVLSIWKKSACLIVNCICLYIKCLIQDNTVIFKHVERMGR